jgi:hypothetical protein
MSVIQARQADAGNRKSTGHQGIYDFKHRDVLWSKFKWQRIPFHVVERLDDLGVDFKRPDNLRHNCMKRD